MKDLLTQSTYYSSCYFHLKFNIINYLPQKKSSLQRCIGEVDTNSTHINILLSQSRDGKTLTTLLTTHLVYTVSLCISPVPWLRLATRVVAFECLKKEHLIGLKGSYQFHCESGDTHLHIHTKAAQPFWSLLHFSVAFLSLSRELKRIRHRQKVTQLSEPLPKLSLANTTNGRGLAASCYAFFHERSLTAETTTQTYSVSVRTIWFISAGKNNTSALQFKE